MGDPETKYIRAVFLDMDNTIIQTRVADWHTIDELIGILYTKYQVPLKIGEPMCVNYLENFRKCPDNPQLDLDTWRKSLWAQALGEEYKHLTDIAYQLWLDLRYKHLEVTSAVTKTLVTLRKSYRLALITNGTPNGQWEKINKLNLAPYFDLILVSGECPWEKPDPNIFLEACRILCVQPHQAIMVGDKLATDILGGQNADLAGTIRIPLPEEKETSPSDPVPDAIIEDFDQVPYVVSLFNRMEEEKARNLPSMLRSISLADSQSCSSSEDS